MVLAGDFRRISLALNHVRSHILRHIWSIDP